MRIEVHNTNTEEVAEIEADDFLEKNFYDSDLEMVLSDLSAEEVGSTMQFENYEITRIEDEPLEY